MDNFTANENWIDKLIDDYVDTKNDIIDLMVSRNQLFTLKEIIFNNTTLDYTGNGLRLNNESAIFEYLRAIYPDSYDIALERLKEEAQRTREAELKEQAVILDNYIENNVKEGTDNG